MLFAIGSKALYAVTRVGLPPLTLAHVGLAEYGLWATCFVLVSYLGMTAAGFTLVYLRHVARHHAAGDTAAIGRLLSTGILTMGTLGLVLLAGLYLGLPWLLSALRVAEPQRELAAQLWLGTCAIFLADMSLGAFGNVLHAIGRVRQEQKVWVVSFLLETLCIVVFLHAGWGTRGLLAAFAVRYLFSVSVAAWLAHRALPGLRLSLAQADRSLLREFFGYGTSVQVAGLMATALHSADRLLASLLVGPQATAVFDLATKLPTTAASAPSSVSGVAVSAAARHDAQGDREGMRRLYGDASRMTVLSLGLLLPFLVAFAEPLTWLWLGPVPVRAQVASVMALLGFGLCWHMMTGPASALFRGRGVMRAEYAYHGLRAVVLALGVGVWWWGAPSHDLTGLALAVAAAQTLAAWLYLAVSHQVLTGAMRGVVAAMLLPMGGALALAEALAMLLQPWTVAAVQVPAGAREALVLPLLGAGLLWGVLFTALVWAVVLDGQGRAQWRARLRVWQQSLTAASRWGRA
jgi:O-antigen/teichoic acid export membrane protein